MSVHVHVLVKYTFSPDGNIITLIMAIHPFATGIIDFAPICKIHNEINWHLKLIYVSSTRDIPSS